MSSAYLTLPFDPPAFGAPDATADQIMRASAAVDGYLGRPEGLIWKPDAAGMPAYMAGLDPALSLALPVAVQAGLNVTVTLPGISPDLIGEAVVINRDGPDCEAASIAAADGTTVTFARLRLDHAAGSTLETGLCIAEERPVGRRSVTQVSRPQAVRLVSGAGRYAPGRGREWREDYGLLASVFQFGTVPLWQAFDPGQASLNATTGEVWVPEGLFCAPYADVRLRYVAGFPADGVPDAIKIATASLIQGVAAATDMGGRFRRFSAGGTTVERFDQTDFDPDIKALLEPYRVRRLA